jgi:hypothetical protein
LEEGEMKIQTEIELRKELLAAMEERTDYMCIFNDMADDFLAKNWFTQLFLERFFLKYWDRYRDASKRYR